LAFLINKRGVAAANKGEALSRGAVPLCWPAAFWLIPFAGRIDTLLQVANAAAPHGTNYECRFDQWLGQFSGDDVEQSTAIRRNACTRPVSESGHNMLGWTLACSSGEQIANLILREPVQQSMVAYASVSGASSTGSHEPASQTSERTVRPVRLTIRDRLLPELRRRE
jgi:hypothetical protein